MNLIEGLNQQQKQAVLHTEGPLLILAGAGSGKTRVVTHRIAYIIEELRVAPWSILAFTFTNKAAREMKERIELLVGNMVDDMWVSTFHSTCVRILRRDAEKIGFDRNFIIFDRTDQLSVIKDCVKELNLNEKNFPHRMVLNEIGRAKDELIEPDKFEKMHESNYRMEKISQVYKLYQDKLVKNNAMDFDDIIMYTIRLFLDNPQVIEYYQHKFRYIHVDEYQDTNTAQYFLINLLAQKSRNLCVVGDDDQSIYSFRGANIKNILDFESEFPDAKVIKLERNYRSTSTILDAANAVISNNIGRKSKRLWTENNKGCNLVHYLMENEHEEALAVASEIKGLVERGEINYRDATILYRANAQSRVLEDIFRREGIQYRILAGLSFYQRKEIKDTISYLRVINNPACNIDLIRIINVPKRGIGNTTVERTGNMADSRGISIFSLLSSVDEIPEISRASVRIKQFVAMINGFFDVKDELGVSDLMKKVMEETGMIAGYESENTLEAKNRIENMKELLSAAMEYEKDREAKNEEASLEDFLAGVSLASDVDSLEDDNSVLMMTIHSAKGLEFPAVFMVGMEEGVFPGYQSSMNETELEEERRLCYVGMTRAKEKLYVLSARSRMLYGRTGYNKPSRFLEEIPCDLVEAKDNTYKTAAPGSGYSNEVKKASFEIFSKNSRFSSNTMDTFKPGVKKPASISKGVPDGNTDLKVGDKVRHKKFGKGIIVGLKQDGDDKKMEIIFDDSGLKRLSALYAKLDKL